MDSGEKEQTQSEKESLIQFRKNLSDVLTPDVTDKVLLKWLRARNFNLKKCEDLYRVDFRARQVFKVGEIGKTWDVPEVLKKYEFTNYLGIAKDGTPIRYIAMGKGDLKGLYMSLDVYDIGKYCISVVEKDLRICKEQSNKLGKEINEITYIFDMEGFNLGHIWFSGVAEMAMDLFRLAQDYYPEIWKNLFVINAPFYFHTVFSLFKPVLRFTVMEKLSVVSKEKSSELLLKYIDADVLPVSLGGKRVDSTGDPLCGEFMKSGGIVPEKYYLSNRSPLLPTDPDVKDVWIPPRGCLNMVVVAREADSSMHVECRSEGGSLPAMLLYRKFEGDPDKHLDLPAADEYLDPNNEKHNVLQCGPYLHLHTHVSPIDNYAYAVWPGIYIFRIDNSYNWWTGRRCVYRIRVEKPNEIGFEINKN